MQWSLGRIWWPRTGRPKTRSRPCAERVAERPWDRQKQKICWITYLGVRQRVACPAYRTLKDPLGCCSAIDRRAVLHRDSPCLGEGAWGGSANDSVSPQCSPGPVQDLPNMGARQGGLASTRARSVRAPPPIQPVDTTPRYSRDVVRRDGTASTAHEVAGGNRTP